MNAEQGDAAPGTALSLSYEVTWDDFIDCQLTHDRHDGAVAMNVRKTRLSLAGFYAFVFLILYPALEGLWRVSILAAIALAGIAHVATVRGLYEARVARLSRKLIKETNSERITGPKKLTLGDLEIAYKERSKTTRIKFTDVTRVLESGRNYFIFTDDVSAIILPKIWEGESEIQARMVALVKSRAPGAGARAT